MSKIETRTIRGMEHLAIEDARLLYTNFSGREMKYNDAGQRNFCVIIDPDIATQLANRGWNIKIKAPREEGDDALHYLPVAINYNYSQPPMVHMYTSTKENLLSENNISCLDSSDILNCDLEIRGREYEPGKIKAYLKAMYVTIDEGMFADKYANYNESEEIPFA